MNGFYHATNMLNDLTNTNCVADSNKNQNNYRFKLIYFDDRGKADLIKLIFACASNTFEDIKIKQSEWSLYKSFMPFEQLPVLIVNDQMKIAQTNTICRFLANYFGLNGSNDLESIMCDMIVEQLRECADSVIFCMQELDHQKRAQMYSRFQSDTLLKTLNGFEKILTINKSKYIVGSRLTWADLAMVNAWEWLDETSRRLFDQYDLVKSHYEFIRRIPLVAEWFAKQTPLRVLKTA